MASPPIRPTLSGYRSVTRHWLAGRLALALAALAAVACMPSSSATPSASPSPAAQAGGTLRVALPRVVVSFSSFLLPPPASADEPLPPTLDPHLDNWYDSAELLRCCLGRTLLSTNGKAADQGGALLHPDLAAELPEISTDGLTWTFRLKPGLRYAPPLQDTEITSADFVRSFQRMLSPQFIEQFSFSGSIFGDIVGAAAYSAGDATSISGLATPDNHTLVIQLVQPAGDLGARVANSGAVPIPPHPMRPDAPFGVADGHDAGSYGRVLVSSGPYMIEGSEAVDFSLPAAEQVTVAGLEQGVRITLVRNPSWQGATDLLRPAQPDQIELFVASTVDDAVAELDGGRADLVVNSTIAPTIPVEIVEALRADPSRGRAYVNEFDAIRGLAINTALPPFDDVHVRLAVALVVDRALLIELQGGPLSYRVGRHLAPDVLLNNLLVDYDPHPSAGDAGDLAAARAEMSRSRYDTDADGTCDAPECSAGLVAASREELTAVGEAVVEDLAQLGIVLDHQVPPREEWFAAYGDPSQKVALFPSIGWVKGYHSAAEFFAGRFYGPRALASGGNGTLVGATATQLEGWGYPATEVPNVDVRIEACMPLVGAAAFDCWAALDQHLVENVAAIVPFASELGVTLASPRVVEFSFDQLVTAPAYDQIVLAP